MASLTLGLDIGSSGTKAVVLDPGTRVLAQASEPVEPLTGPAGWAEAAPARWWSNVCALIPKVIAQAGVGAQDIGAVAATGMVPAVVPLDAAGRPLRNAILQNDARAGAEIEELAAKLSERDFDHLAETGSDLTQQSVAPTLMWLAQHEPAVWAATRQVVGSYDYIARALGAAPHVERNWAIESGLYPLHGGEPITTVLEAAGFDAARLAPVADPGTVVGTVTAAAADQTGLAPGTAIVVGGADHVLSAYAAGLAKPGDVLVKLGGAADILVVTDGPFLDRRLYLDAHPQPGSWLSNGCMATSGTLISWFQRNLAPGSTIADLEVEAAAASPAELITLPFWLGEKSPWHDPDLRGAFLGLHTGHTRGDMYRSILEAIAYGFRHHIDIYDERRIPLAASCRVSNGGSKSRIWKQILADALGKELIPVRDHPGGSLGAALSAAVGVELLQEWSAIEHLVRTEAPVVPDPGLTHRYTEAYQFYRDAADALVGISHRLAQRSTTP